MSSTVLTRRHLLQATLAVATVGCATAKGDDALRAAVDGPQRTPAFRTRDAARHPYETLRFFDVDPTQTIVEVAPGGGWYTEILAPYLRAQGRYYVAHYEADDGTGHANFDRKLAADPASFDRVASATPRPKPRGFAGLSVPGGADRVLTFRNVHNWIEDGTLDESLRAFHAALRPGGLLGVEEHRADPGTPLPRVIATGYVPEAFLVEHAEAAGFRFVARSEVNANPLDRHDHANGVWSLPPTLRGGAVDRERYVAIGESDRMTLKFVKA